MRMDGIANRLRGGSLKVIVVLAMIAVTMAAAGFVGQSFASEVPTSPGGSGTGAGGEVDVAASRALAVVGGSVSGADGRIIASEDGRSFKAPAEVHTGDRFTVNLALANKSQKPLEAQITISVPEYIALEVQGLDGAHGVVRVAPDSWAFVLDAGEGDEEPDLAIGVSVNGVAQPGFYKLKTTIEPLGFWEGSDE